MKAQRDQEIKCFFTPYIVSCVCLSLTVPSQSYLLGEYLLPRASRAREDQGEEVRKEKDRGTKSETTNPIPSNWCAHRGWRTGRKTEERKKKKNREWTTNPATPDHLVRSYDPRGSYGGPIPETYPQPTHAHARTHAHTHTHARTHKAKLNSLPLSGWSDVIF